MPAVAHRVHHTWADYLALEATSNVKHELLDGQIYAMAGGTPDHAALQAAVFGLLVPQLRAGRCRAYAADLRVRVLATGLATYPDATVVCGPRELDPENKNTVTNPTLLLEVLSPSTEEYDRGEKFDFGAAAHAIRTGRARNRAAAATRRAGGRGESAKMSYSPGVSWLVLIPAAL